MTQQAPERIEFARWIARKLNAYPQAGFTLLIPERGVSELDKPGNAFYDPEADRALFEELEKTLILGPNRKIKRLREVYPEVNVQVFYQKDFENLIFKYGLEKTAEMIG